MPTFLLPTPHGAINITDTALQPPTPAPTLLLIHGNSSSTHLFRPILTSPRITTKWRILAFDLPGHGASSNAPDPEKSYSMRGYADLAIFILQHLRIADVIVFGWSLGGHVGIEMLPLLPSHGIQMRGLLLTGTPPVLGAEQVRRGFLFGGGLSLAGKEVWTDDEADIFARTSAAAGREECFEPWMLENAKRTDGRARVLMSRKVGSGDGVDQRGVVETSEDVLVGVVNGADEPFINLQYLDEIRWMRLWREKCVRLEGLRHAPFWESPEVFEKLLVEFLEDCAKVE